MNYWWHQIVRFYTWDGTLEGAVFMVAMGAVAGLIIALVLGAILIAIEVVWSIPQVWREGLAEGLAKGRAKRLAKQGIRPDDSRPAPPPGDVPPTSDI